jgi:hypothetical protein
MKKPRNQPNKNTVSYEYAYLIETIARRNECKQNHTFFCNSPIPSSKFWDIGNRAAEVTS